MREEFQIGERQLWCRFSGTYSLVLHEGRVIKEGVPFKGKNRWFREEKYSLGVIVPVLKKQVEEMRTVTDEARENAGELAGKIKVYNQHIDQWRAWRVIRLLEWMGLLTFQKLDQGEGEFFERLTVNQQV